MEPSKLTCIVIGLLCLIYSAMNLRKKDDENSESSTVQESGQDIV